MNADDAGLNAALVTSTQDFEHAMIAPITIPRVIDEPVVHVVLIRLTNRSGMVRPMS